MCGTTTTSAENGNCNKQQPTAFEANGADVCMRVICCMFERNSSTLRPTECMYVHAHRPHYTALTMYLLCSPTVRDLDTPWARSILLPRLPRRCEILPIACTRTFPPAPRCRSNLARECTQTQLQGQLNSLNMGMMELFYEPPPKPSSR